MHAAATRLGMDSIMVSTEWESHTLETRDPALDLAMRAGGGGQRRD